VSKKLIIGNPTPTLSSKGKWTRKTLKRPTHEQNTTISGINKETKKERREHSQSKLQYIVTRTTCNMAEIEDNKATSTKQIELLYTTPQKIILEPTCKFPILFEERHSETRNQTTIKTKDYSRNQLYTKTEQNGNTNNARRHI